MALDTSQFSFFTTVEVRWGDMDAYNHVNNTCFFRYFETSRIHFFEETDLLTGMGNSGVGPILAETRCRFIKPISYPDSLQVAAKVASVGNSSFVMEHGIWSDKLGLCAEGTAIVVIIDYRDGKKVPHDEVLRRRLESFIV